MVWYCRVYTYHVLTVCMQITKPTFPSLSGVCVL